MTDRPIIFSGQMIRAMLDGRKTMTRRLAWNGTKPEPRFPEGTMRASPWQRVKPGELILVRETHYRYGRWVKDGTTKTGKQRWRFRAAATSKIPDNTGVYFMDNPPSEIAASRTQLGWHKRPSIFMPRWASRLTLIVTATKMERLQEISEVDAMAEGVERAIAGSGMSGGVAYTIATFRTGFVRIWGELHGTDSWLSNPEVVAISFRVIKANIDAPEALAA